MTKTKINFEPKSKHFLIKTKEKSPGGIIIPESVMQAMYNELNSPQEVLCPAPDCVYVKEGDYIMMEPHQVQMIEIDGHMYIICAEYRVSGKMLNYTPPKPAESKPTIILNND